jgi:hypothetical protein
MMSRWITRHHRQCYLVKHVYGATDAAADSPGVTKGGRFPAICLHTRFLNYGTCEASKSENNNGQKRQKRPLQPDAFAIDATASSTPTTTNTWNRAKLTKARMRRRKIRILGAL